MKTTFRQSPNITLNCIIKPLGIVLHHTAGSFQGSVNWCLDTKSKVSYHCIVDVNGDRVELAKDNQRAHHAGVSRFKGRSDCNSFMLGIAVSGDTYKRRLTNAETNSVALWCIDKMKLYNFDIDWITTHRAISPGRKFDVDPRAESDILQRIKELL